MPVKTVTIDEIGSRGDGIGSIPEGPVYIPFTVPGDVVEAELIPSGKKAFSGKIKKIIQAGEGRAEPKCQHFGICGGCTLQHVGKDLYQNWIKSRVEVALSHQGFEGVFVKEPYVATPQSRRRISLRAIKLKNGVVLGFNESKSHNIVNLTECPVTKTELINLLPALRDLLGEVLKERQSSSLHMTLTDTGVQLVLELRDEPDLRVRELLGNFANTFDLAAIAVKVDGFLDPIAKRKTPMLKFGSAAVSIPFGAFLQASEEGENELGKCVLKASGKAENVLDLFSGLGTFALRLAQVSKTHAVEGDAKLIERLQNSANQNNSLKGVTTEHRDLFRRPLLAMELNKFDCVVFDPPRAGAKAQVEEIAKSDIPIVIGVSCNPNTFARDARMLVDGGYKLEYVQPVDQFLWSYHVELVAKFSK